MKMEFKIKCVWEFLKENGFVFTVRGFDMKDKFGFNPYFHGPISKTLNGLEKPVRSVERLLFQKKIN